MILNDTIFLNVQFSLFICFLTDFSEYFSFRCNAKRFQKMIEVESVRRFFFRRRISKTSYVRWGEQLNICLPRGREGKRENAY